MVKSYLKFQESKAFGVIASGTSNLIWSSQQRSGSSLGQAIVAANEDVLCWDLNRGELLSRWHDEKNKYQVTAIAESEVDKDVVAVGYEDGSIRLWDCKFSTVMVSFNGHKSAITHLKFDKSGVRLASGSNDTDVIIWDLVSETALFKLRGHTDQITGLCFVEPSEQILNEDNEDTTESSDAVVLGGTAAGEGFLITTSKDSRIKLWDLTSRHSIETHVAQTSGECWALGVSHDFSGCITAGNDGELQVWTIRTAALAASVQQVDGRAEDYIVPRGTLYRQGKDKTAEISFHPQKDYFAVHGVEKGVEIWRIRTESEIKKALARKRRRRREKLAAKGVKKNSNGDAEMAEGDSDDENVVDLSKADISEFFVLHVILRTSGKVRSADWAMGSRVHKQIQLLVGTTNNQLELYSISTKKERSSKKEKKEDSTPNYSRAAAVERSAHRTDIRAASLSSDDTMLATAANGSLKIWNVQTQECIRTYECGYALCCSFLPGDRIVIVGTKAGELELFDMSLDTETLLDSVAAHDGAIWSLQVHPDGRSVVTGSADKTAKFWDLKVVQEPVLGTTRTASKLRLVQTKVLKVSDDILCLRFSPDARLLAVSLLDNTVKVFFTDSLKLYLNLYGHKLPVLSMDISYDSKLIITSSADKNVKIWGLDFGDCHRSLFANQESVLQVAFVPHNNDQSGHHFFSCGKGKAIKYWDGDKFEQIQRLDGHFGEIWALAVSHSGTFLVTASHDKSIRVWDETDEQVFLEEEREREIEELYENTLTTSLERDADPEDMDADGQLGEVGVASKQTTETLMAGERIEEALNLGMEDLNAIKAWEEEKKRAAQAAARAHASGATDHEVAVRIAPPQRHIVFVAQGNISAETYVMNVLKKIPAASLHDALLVLSFDQVPALLTFLNLFAMQKMNMPLTSRVLLFILKTHHRQIVSSRTMRVMMDGVRNSLRKSLQEQKGKAGRNEAALRVLVMHTKESSITNYVDEHLEENRAKAAQSVRKRAFMQVA